MCTVSCVFVNYSKVQLDLENGDHDSQEDDRKTIFSDSYVEEDPVKITLWTCLPWSEWVLCENWLPEWSGGEFFLYVTQKKKRTIYIYIYFGYTYLPHLTIDRLDWRQRQSRVVVIVHTPSWIRWVAFIHSGLKVCNPLFNDHNNNTVTQFCISSRLQVELYIVF